MASRRKLLWAAVAAASVLATFSATAEGGFRRYLKLSRDVQSLREKNSQLQRKNTQLAAEIEALRTGQAAQEQAAREELGFIKPGEMIFALEADAVPGAAGDGAGGVKQSGAQRYGAASDGSPRATESAALKPGAARDGSGRAKESGALKVGAPGTSESAQRQVAKGGAGGGR